MEQLVSADVHMRDEAMDCSRLSMLSILQQAADLSLLTCSGVGGRGRAWAVPMLQLAQQCSCTDVADMQNVLLQGQEVPTLLLAQTRQYFAPLSVEFTDGITAPKVGWRLLLALHVPACS